MYLTFVIMAHSCNLNGINVDAMKWHQRILLISADNPRRFIYFKSDVSIREEQQRQLETCRHTIHPFSKFRVWYDIYLIYLYSSLLITKPIDSGFSEAKIAHHIVGYLSYTALTDLLCFVDIGVNFFTGYKIPDAKSIELRLSCIAKRYVCSPYFFCDVVSSIPRGLIYGVPYSGAVKNLTGVVSMLGFLKLFRLITLIHCFGRASEYLGVMSKGLLSLFNAIVTSLLIIHWMACLQFAVPKLVRTSFVAGLDNMSWIYRHNLYNKPWWIQYSHSLFRSSANILCVHLDLYSTDLTEEYLLALATYFTGKILIAFIWIILALAILNSRTMDIKFSEIINQLEEYMKKKQLPLDLRNKIFQYFTFKFQRKYFKEQMITNMLSENLRKEVNLHVCKSLIENVSLFNELTSDEIAKVIEYLIPEIFLPHDIIVQAGSHGDAMYFLSSGTVAVFSRTGKEICHLQDGAYFGEIALVIKNQTRPNTVLAIETTHVYRLNRRALDKCLLSNTKVLAKIVRNAEKRLLQTTSIDDTYKKQLFEKNL